MHFDAFDSENYPPLAKAGVKINYNFSAIHTPNQSEPLRLLTRMDSNISILKLFPGINQATVEAILNTSGLKAVVLETFGSGNAPSAKWLLDGLKAAIGKGILILNISQCPGGMVIQGKYETSKALNEIGVISGADMTTEAAITKLMILLGEYGYEETVKLISKPLIGELT